MSKEQILEEFNEKLLKVCDVYEKAADNTSEKLENWEKERKEIKQFLSQAIDQTREETIRKCEGVLPKYQEVPPYYSNGDNAFESGIISGRNELLEEIKQSLINLHK